MFGPREEADDLEELALRKVAYLIRSGRAKNIIVLTGAGISTSAGIPDFRSPGTGLYANLAKLNLPDPQAVFDIDYFRKRPEPFWTLAKDLYPGKYLPTPTHHFLSLLSSPAHPLLLRLFSQNIDTLEFLAGVPHDRIVEAHGSFGGARCIDCGRAYGRGYVLREGVREGRVVRCRGEGDREREGDDQGGEGEEGVDGGGGGGGGEVRLRGQGVKSGDSGESGERGEKAERREGGEEVGKGKGEHPKPKGMKPKVGTQRSRGRRSTSTSTRTSTNGKGCGGLVKPDIVFFGESLPERFFERMPDMRQADLVLIIGTSLQVGPFCHLPSAAPPNCPKVLINREAVGEFVGTEKRQRRYFEQVRAERRAEQRAGVKAQAEAVNERIGAEAKREDTARAGPGKGTEIKREYKGAQMEGGGGGGEGKSRGAQARRADHANVNASAGSGAPSQSDKSADGLSDALRQVSLSAHSPTTPAHPSLPTLPPTHVRSKSKSETLSSSPLPTDQDVKIDPDIDPDAGYTSPDAFYRGDADTAIYRLADMLGWREELKGRVKEVNERLGREWGL